MHHQTEETEMRKQEEVRSTPKRALFQRKPLTSDGQTAQTTTASSSRNDGNNGPFPDWLQRKMPRWTCQPLLEQCMLALATLVLSELCKTAIRQLHLLRTWILKHRKNAFDNDTLSGSGIHTPKASNKFLAEDATAEHDALRTPEDGERPLADRGHGMDTVLPVGPRSDYLGWEDFFMSAAALASLRSKDPRTRVGAVIVASDGIVCGMGYNGMPRGVPDSSAPWSRRRELSPSGMSKHDFVCHAEMNAILNRNSLNLSSLSARPMLTASHAASPSTAGATNTASPPGVTSSSRMYVTLFPCCECAKLIVQAGIGEVVYETCKSPTSAAAANHIFHMAGVRVRHHARSSHCLSLVPINASVALSEN